MALSPYLNAVNFSAIVLILLLFSHSPSLGNRSTFMKHHAHTELATADIEHTACIS